MKQLYLSLILLITVVSTAWALPAPWNTRHITMLDGLPTNTVRSIMQDKDGFIWMGSDNGLCRYDGYEVKRYRNPLISDQFVGSVVQVGQTLLVGTSHGAFIFDVRTGEFRQMSKSITSTVNAITVDADGDIWVATAGQGLYCYQPGSKACVHYNVKGSNGSFTAVFADNDNQVWALTRQGRGVYHFNKARKAFDIVPIHGDVGHIDGMCMAQGLDGTVLIGTWDSGLLALHRDGKVERLMNSVNNGTATHIHTIYNDSPNVVYIGCEEGLLRYDMQRHTTQMVTGGGFTPASDRFVYAVTRDREGGLWMGTFYGGVTYFSPLGERFASYTVDGDMLRGSVVSRFCEQAGTLVWIATDDGGLNCYNMRENRFVDFPGKSVLSGMNVHGLWAEKGTLWVGTYGNGIFRLNTTTGAMKAYSMDNLVGKASCYAIMRDRRGRLWAASMENAYIFDNKLDSFRLVKNLKTMTVDIEEDRRGNVWFATQGNGLWCFTAKGQWKHYEHSEDSTSICSNTINSIRESMSGRLYIATYDGLCEYVPSRDCFRHVYVKSPNQNFMGLAINNDEIWLSSTKALLRLEPGGNVQIYNSYDGLLDGPFQPNACMMASDGRVWLGSVNGVNAFYPYQIKANKNEPHVVITGFEFPGHDNPEMDSLSGVLSHRNGVVVEYSENMFTIHFSALSYVSPEKNRYQYMLKGFDDDWIDAGTENKATYTNISPGTYTFMVRACNNDGVWTKQPAMLKVTVHPPFYWSLPAKIFYVILIGFLIWFYVHARLRKAERRHQREMEAASERKEQELRDAQLHFFTMIAHEIRTPVTLIIGPLESLKERWRKAMAERKVSGEATQTLDVIDRNAHRLLTLVNQLLDYNKVQQHGMQMHFQVCNISQLMHAVAERFIPTLKQKNVTLTVDYPADSFTAVVDSEALTKIMSNLMTNATKYTKSKVRLSCIPDGDNFRIEVEDDGVGISDDEQKKIFRAFYQARDNKPGTGIGLSIVKNLVGAHHGTVTVKSKVGVGSLFTVTLPVSQPDVAIGEEKALPVTEKEEEVSVQNVEAVKPEEEGSGLPAVLVVEDDEDLLHYLSDNFKPNYRVYTAENGVQALEVLKKTDVSLIVSDWMMPEMDGAELCRKVRANRKTSHIPFIMLTAKTDDDSKTLSMDCGADAFIEKPFSMKYLEAAIRNLIDMRRQLQQKYSHSPVEPITQLASSSVDTEFLKRIKQVIEENVSNHDFGVVMLAEQMGVSRSGLFAKIKALADMTPNEMIQVERLKKAAEMLKEHKYRINEVCFAVGFNSPGYFSKCFQKQFGVKPIDYANS